MLKRALFKIARSPAAGAFIGFAFAHLTGLMPVEKLVENERAVVLRHPAPVGEVHWLGAPKMRLPSLAALDLADGETRACVTAVFQALALAAEGEGIRPYTILVNGGAYQDVPQIHFHLLQDGMAYEPVLPPGNEVGWAYGQAVAYPHPRSDESFHVIIAVNAPSAPLPALDLAQPAAQAQLLDCLALAQQVAARQNMTAFRLLTYCGYATVDPGLTFHLMG
ncbi:MAG TPA: HIT domain-containing protein [Anaerolineae bacterium]|nr:HIT domain-containing protein [Anaerolineae bacterium]